MGIEIKTFFSGSLISQRPSMQDLLTIQPLLIEIAFAVSAANAGTRYEPLFELLTGGHDSTEDHTLPGMAAGRIADLLEAQDSPEATIWRERSR